MKRLTSLAVLAAVAATPTFAGGLNTPSVEPVVVAPQMQPQPMAMAPSDWTGFYAGAQAGFGTLTRDVPGGDFDEDYNAYGLHAGYNYDLGSLVLGAEAAYDRFDLQTTGNTADVGRLGARVGYDLGKFLPYATAGVASLSTNIGSGDATDMGYYYGFGVDYRVTDSITTGVQLLRQEFNDFDNSGSDIQADQAQLSVSYNF